MCLEVDIADDDEATGGSGDGTGKEEIFFTMLWRDINWMWMCMWQTGDNNIGKEGTIGKEDPSTGGGDESRDTNREGGGEGDNENNGECDTTL